MRGGSYVYVDRHGRVWRPSQAYQMQDASAPGWLELENRDDRLSMSEVMAAYGIGEDRHLIARLA